MNRKDAYVQKLEEQLESWADEIAALDRSANDFDGEDKVQHLQAVDRLRAQQEIARHKLANLRKAGEAEWQDMKTSVDTAWRNLGDAIRTAAARHA